MCAFANPGDFKNTKIPILIFKHFKKWKKGSLKQKMQ